MSDRLAVDELNALRSVQVGLGRGLSKVIPGLDDYVFNRDRDRSHPGSRVPRGGYQSPLFRDRTPHLIVVPVEGPQFPDWRAGTRNFYYEAWQSAREIFGEPSVSVLDVAPGESHDSWHGRLADMVKDLDATHVLTHLEHDPGSPDRWNWDSAWKTLASSWDGVFLGVMFDSAFDLVQMKARRMARTSSNFLAVDICTSLAGGLVRGRSEVGPVTMPMSQQSMSLVKDRLEGLTQTHDISFIGALYPYRVELIQHLRSQGFDVAVNPHRSDATTDFASSRTDQPGWLDYMAGLAQSRMTINFSRSSAGSFEQLKTRVIEAALAGTFLLTDDIDSTRRYFTPDIEYGYFANVESLPTVAESWLNKPEKREAGALIAQSKAQSIAHQDFYASIQEGLRARGLPLLSESSALT